MRGFAVKFPVYGRRFTLGVEMGVDIYIPAIGLVSVALPELSSNLDIRYRARYDN